MSTQKTKEKKNIEKTHSTDKANQNPTKTSENMTSPNQLEKDALNRPLNQQINSFPQIEVASNHLTSLSKQSSQINSQIISPNQSTGNSNSINYDHEILKKLNTRLMFSGELAMPAMPSGIDFLFHRLIESIGNKVTVPEQDKASLKAKLLESLKHGFQASPNAYLIVKWSMTGNQVNFNFKLNNPSIPDKYNGWLQTRPSPLFGSQPDAKVFDLLEQKFEGKKPQELSILEIGPGQGRTLIPLAEKGYKVDAVELTPEFAKQLTQQVNQNNWQTNIICGNFLDPNITPNTSIRANHSEVVSENSSNQSDKKYDLIFASQVTPHFRRESGDLEIFIQKASNLLSKDGLFLMFIFLAKDNYQPSNILLEAAEECWSTCFTTQELNKITESASLEILSNESVHDYEQTHIPADKWPPVNWFPGWTKGSNIFHNPSFQSPIEARWIVMQKGK